MRSISQLRIHDFASFMKQKLKWRAIFPGSVSSLGSNTKFCGLCISPPAQWQCAQIHQNTNHWEGLLTIIRIEGNYVIFIDVKKAISLYICWSHRICQERRRYLTDTYWNCYWRHYIHWFYWNNLHKLSLLIFAGSHCHCWKPDRQPQLSKRVPICPYIISTCTYFSPGYQRSG